MYCKHCGKEIADDSKFCQHCGLKITDSARAYIFEGEIYELIGDKDRAIANYLVAVKLFAANNYFQETKEFAARVLSLDSTNVEVKELLGSVQK